MKNELKKRHEELEVILEELIVKLRDSERRYRDLLENLSEVIYAVDQQGVITYISPVIERLSGYQPFEVTGRRFTELVHRDDMSIVSESFQKVLDGQPDSRECRFVTRFGETRWAWISSRPVISDNRVTGVRGILTDITGRKEAEESLRLLQDGFRNSLDNSPLGIRIATADGETLYSNKALLDIYGYNSIDELRSTPVSQRYTAEGYIGYQIRNERRRLGLPVPNTYEVSIRRKDGETRDLRVFRKEVTWAGKTQFQIIYQDITALKLAEKKLLENEDRLAEAQEIGHLGSWEWDISTKEIIWSDEKYRILGFAPQQFPPSYDAFLECVHPGDNRYVKESILETIAEGKPMDATFRITRPDGSERFVHAVGRLITDSMSGSQRMIGIIHDITDHKKTEEKLRALSQRLVGLQEEERRSIARDLHDDIAQPLGFLKLVLDNEMAAAEPKITGLNKASAIVDEIIMKVRDLSLNLRPGVLDDLGLVPALLWYFGRYSSQTGITVDFKHHGVNRRLPSRIDTTLYRVVQEALANVARHAGTDRVTVRLKGNQQELRIIVEDRGRGFDLASVAPSSTGIDSMRERIRMEGGEFEIDSTPGESTRVSLQVPLPAARRSQRKIP